MTLTSVMNALKHKGSEKNRVTYARHGMSPEKTLGVSVADMKLLMKQIKGQQELAMELYATGVMEAMYLAGLVASGKKMTREQLQSWAEGSGGMQMISEYAVPWVTVESAYADELANVWIDTDAEHVATAGWCTHSGLVATQPDEALDLHELERLMARVVSKMGGAQNRVRYTMNHFVISVGTYVQALQGQAMAVAEKIGPVNVDVGDTACKVPSAVAYLKTRGAAKKRRTIRC